jgi:hypothetical protein
MVDLHIDFAISCITIMHACMHGVHVSNLYISTHFFLEILFTETLRFLNQNEFTEFANAPDQ